MIGTYAKIKIKILFNDDRSIIWGSHKKSKRSLVIE